MKKKNAAEKALDSEIEKIFRQNCEGVQISVFDIAKVFEAGRKAKAEGRDMKEAIIACVESIRKN